MTPAIAPTKIKADEFDFLNKFKTKIDALKHRRIK